MYSKDFYPMCFFKSVFFVVILCQELGDTMEDVESDFAWFSDSEKFVEQVCLLEITAQERKICIIRRFWSRFR